MNIYIDTAYKSLNKYTEELCGDRVEIIRTPEFVILVLADGLGSGVKANILSTLTSKIIATMLSNGAKVEDCVDTIASTLPICNVRHLAYSTFSILQIFYTGEVYLVEFDNPTCVFLRGNKLMEIPFENRVVSSKNIREARFQTAVGDSFVLFSVGVIHAGVGAVLNFGFQWENAAAHLQSVVQKEKTAARLALSLSQVCESLYAGKPGDDTTVAAVKILPEKVVNLFTGPPSSKEKDPELLHDFMAERGKRVVCGGSSAQIISRLLNRPVKTSINYTDPELPPIGYIDGMDLVTEGVLTLSKTNEILTEFRKNDFEYDHIKELDRDNGASKLAKLLLEDCTRLNLFVGKAVNAAHQNPNLPVDLNIRQHIVNQLTDNLRAIGKIVNVKYY